MKSTIKGKIIRTNILIVTIALLVFTFLMNFAVKTLLEREIQSDLASEKKLMSSIIPENFTSIRNAVDSDVKIIIRAAAAAKRTPLDSQFEIYVKNNNNLRLLGKNDFLNDEINEEILSVIENKNYNDLNTFTLSNKSYYYTVSALAPIRKNTTPNTWLVQYTPATVVNNALATIRRISFLLLLILIAVASIMGYMRGKRIADPIKEIESRANQIARRNYAGKISIHTGDEVEDLALSIESMADQLESYDKSQKQFIQNITHELKTPLTSIQGYAEGIKDGVFHEGSESLDIIIDESKRLKKLVNQIIFLSKLESFNDFYDYSWENIEDLVNTSIDKVKGFALKNNIKVITDLKDKLDLECDREKFVQALLNILSNSIKFAKSRVFIEGQMEEDGYTLRIFDDGKGFSEKDLLNAFQRFYKGDKGDTGLGLTITKTIINKTGGTLSIENREGFGGEYIIKFKS